jgi:hypothetical protein
VDRFEADGANCARASLREHNISQREIDTVSTAIALHTTLGIPQYLHPVAALLTNGGVKTDVLGIAYSEVSDAGRKAIVAAYPRTGYFKEYIIRTSYGGIEHKPETTLGNMKADVLATRIQSSSA